MLHHPFYSSRAPGVGCGPPTVSSVQGGVPPADADMPGPPTLGLPTRTRRRVLRGVGALRNRWALWSDSSYRHAAHGYHLPGGASRVYLHHVRKTAGTSLFLSFLALGGEDPMDVWRRLAASRLQRTFSGPYSFASNDRTVLAEGAYFFGRSHRPATDQPLPSRTFTVTILRDPVARVHSYYDYLVAGDAPDMPGQVAGWERRHAADGFDAFLDRVPVGGLLTQLAMFSDRLEVAEAVDRIAACSSVFFTEDFADGLAHLGTRLDLPLTARRVRVTEKRSLLSERQTERLRDRLEPEYELLAALERGGIARIGDARGS